MLKFRRQFGLFIAEGPKVVNEVLNSHFTVHSIYATPDWFGRHNVALLPGEKFIITDIELKKISHLKTPNNVLALIEIPEAGPLPDPSLQLLLMLDEIKDPGNLGTIIRTADWFGVKHIICSINCVDVYNPKVVQSAMGSVTRVNIHYIKLASYLSTLDKIIPVYGTVLNGTNIFSTNLSTHGIILTGSESHGISPALLPYITRRISIPNFSESASAESLNASIATAITLAEFKRRGI